MCFYLYDHALCEHAAVGGVVQGEGSDSLEGLQERERERRGGGEGGKGEGRGLEYVKEGEVMGC